MKYSALELKKILAILEQLSSEIESKTKKQIGIKIFSFLGNTRKDLLFNTSLLKNSKDFKNPKKFTLLRAEIQRKEKQVFEPAWTLFVGQTKCILEGNALWNKHEQAVNNASWEEVVLIFIKKINLLQAYLETGGI